MSDIGLGLKHYLLILMPSLIDVLNDYGLELASSHPQLNEHDSCDPSKTSFNHD